MITICIHCTSISDAGDSRWVGMWWGGFLLGGLMLILVSIPFFSFPKVLTREKEKMKMIERQPTGTTGTSNSTNNNANNTKITRSNSSTKNDTGYGKDVKGRPILKIKNVWSNSVRIGYLFYFKLGYYYHF